MGGPTTTAFLAAQEGRFICDRIATSLLQLSDRNVLLVLGITRCLGRSQPDRHVLVSSPRVLGGDDLLCRCLRVRSQLVQESNFALRPYWPALPDCRCCVSSFRHARSRSQLPFRMARRRRCDMPVVSAGVALRSTRPTLIHSAPASESHRVGGAYAYTVPSPCSDRAVDCRQRCCECNL